MTGAVLAYTNQPQTIHRLSDEELASLRSQKTDSDQDMEFWQVVSAEENARQLRRNLDGVWQRLAFGGEYR